MRETRNSQWQQAIAVSNATPAQRALLHKQFFAKYDHYLDLDCNVDWLRNPRIAAMIRGNLYHHCNSKYQILAYCIMPNHVHVLLRTSSPIESAFAENDLRSD